MALNPGKLAKRVLTPGFVVSLVYYLRYGAKISPKSEVELSDNFTMGPGCVIGSFSKVKAADGPLTMGARCGIATNCFVASGENGIEIGDNFVCGPNSVITASNYIYDEIGVHIEDQGTTSKGVRIGNNVWIGGGSVILDGTVLGDNCIVVANSLVNRRYPENSIIQGNPAKILMKRTPRAGAD
ncbi:MAG: acyltransferase [Pseudomonadota bacterium]